MNTLFKEQLDVEFVPSLWGPETIDPSAGEALGTSTLLAALVHLCLEKSWYHSLRGQQRLGLMFNNTCCEGSCCQALGLDSVGITCQNL